MHECDVLKWAAGAMRPVLGKAAVDEERLIRAVHHHRLTGRLLHRIEQERPRWPSDNLLAALRERQTAAELRLQRQVQSVREIRAQLVDTKQLPVIIKGLSTYALTARRESIRPSSDVDIFFSDPRTLSSALLNSGYAPAKPPAPHEFATFQREDMFIEIHRYLPVWSYPESMNSADLVPANNPGIWIQTHDADHKGIEYSDLIENATTAKASEISDLIVPDPTMAAMVLCTHTFTNYVLGSASLPLATVRLGGLAEICDLVRHLDFDADRFVRLVDKFAGQSAVALCSHLMSTYFGFDCLKDIATQLRHDEVFVFPRRLWYGFWVDLDWPEDDVLIRQVSIDNIIGHLGANTVVATSSGEARTYAALAPGAGERVDRVIARRTDGRSLPIQFSVDWGDKAISFAITVLEKPDLETDRIRVDFGDTFCEWSYDVRRGEAVLEGAQAEVKMVQQERGYKLHLTLPWERLSNPWKHLPSVSPDMESIPLWLGAVRQGPDFYGAVTGTLVPINLVREGIPSP